MHSLNTCAEKFSCFKNSIKALLETYLPVRSVKRCSNDRPWVTDSFRDLVKRRQRAFASGNRPLYKWYGNRVNRARKNLQRVYYRRKIGALQSQQHKK